MKRVTVHVASLSLVGQALCYSPAAKTNHKIHSRRKAFSILCSPAITSCAFAPIAYAAKDDTTIIDADVSLLREATEVLDSLLDNWEKATVDCTYADVPRELLEAKNKEKLLEKVSINEQVLKEVSFATFSYQHKLSSMFMQASEFALFDKSASVVSCKKTNRIVRDYIGATGKGPLVGAEKRLLKSNVVDTVDPDNLDEYFSGTLSQ